MQQGEACRVLCNANLLNKPRSGTILLNLSMSAQAPKLPPRVPLEPEMDKFVRNFGGQLVLDALGTRSPPFANADYWFERDNVVAELKCLSEDKSDDVQISAAMNKLFNDLINSGRMPDPGPGRFIVQSANCPVEFQKGLYKILARPIRRRLHKANRQIKATRVKLGCPDAYGLVFLANDGNYRLEPAQFRCAVDVAIGRDFSGVEGLILFTVNMLSTSPIIQEHSSHAALWMPCPRVGHRALPDEFVRRFIDDWSKHVGQFVGEEIKVVRDFDAEQLESFRCDQKVSKARR
jgi:hypothetical protein